MVIYKLFHCKYHLQINKIFALYENLKYHNERGDMFNTAIFHLNENMCSIPEIPFCIQIDILIEKKLIFKLHNKIFIFKI